MTTKTTDKTESTTAAVETETNDNKKVFGPLGKYAVVSVIMVSIIVTTAIMLNKQLGSIDEELAAIESEVAEISEANGTSVVTEAVVSEANIASEEITEIPATVVASEAEVSNSAIPVTETPVTAAPVVTTDAAEVTNSEAVAVNEQEDTAEAVTAEVTASDTPAADDQFSISMAERDQERQARTEANKLEQKQRMSEMFARIKALEAQQLESYQSKQDERVEHLRQQIAKQEQLIEALILRNKEWVDMRAASMQRSQSHREEMLDRI